MRIQGALLLAMVALGVCLLAANGPAQEARNEHVKAIREEYHRAREAKEAPNKELVLEHLHAIVAADPSDADALHMVYDLGTDFVLDSLQRGGNHREVIHELLRRAERAHAEHINNADEIKEQVALLGNADNAVAWKAIGNLVDKYGAFAVPYLVENLADSVNERLRTMSHVCLGKMGIMATLPLAEALNAQEITVRQKVVVLLGETHDERAAGYLKKVLETDPDEVTKKYAAQGLVKITQQGPEGWWKATDYFLRDAEMYYHDRPEILKAPKLPVVWHWDESATPKLVGTKVPEFSFNERMAERTAYEALYLDGSLMPAWTVLTNAFFQQELEATATVSALRRRMASDSAAIDAAQVEELAGIADSLYKVRGLSTVAGKGILYQSLTRALDEETPEVAVAVIEALKKVESGNEFPQALAEGGYARPLIRSLSAFDKRIRYAASEMLLTLNTLKDFEGKELVVPNLNDALGQIALRVVLVVSRDKNFQNHMKVRLEEMGYFPLTVSSRLEAMSELRSFPTEDMLIIDEALGRGEREVWGAESFHLVQDVRKDVALKETPVILFADISTEEAERKERLTERYAELNVQDYFYSLRADDVQARIKTVFEGFQVAESRQKANDAAAQSARVIASINPRWTTYPVERLVDALVGNLTNREDYIIIPSAEALGNLGDGQALTPLANVFGNKDASVAVRVACGNAMAEVIKATNSISEIALNTLREVMHEGNKDIELAASRVLGVAPLSPEERFAILNSERPQK